jgi:uncharacterized RDD family membrane protein YckC
MPTPAGVWRRFMCAGYEALILFAVAVFFGYAFSALTRFEGHLPQADGLRLAFQIYLLLVIGVYFGWFWSRGRRTLPMKTLGVQLTDRQGQALAPSRAALRYIAVLACLAVPVALIVQGLAIGFALLPLPFAWALFNKSRSTLYDQLAGTCLILDEPSSRRPGQTQPPAASDTQSTK